MTEVDGDKFFCLQTVTRAWLEINRIGANKSNNDQHHACDDPFHATDSTGARSRKAMPDHSSGAAALGHHHHQPQHVADRETEHGLVRLQDNFAERNQR